MNKNSKKVLTRVLAIMLVATFFFAFAGCGKTNEASDGTAATVTAAGTQQEATAPEVKEIKPVEISITENDDPNAIGPTWDKVLNDFMAKNPAITVKRTHGETEAQRTDWQNAVLGGAGPEIISCPHDNIGVFGTANTAMDLNTLLPKEFFKQFSEKDINDYVYEGKTLAIPYHVGNALTLIYNKKLLPEAPATFDELITKAKELTKGTSQYGLVFDEVEPFFILPYLGGFGGKVLDGHKLTLDTPEMKKLVQLVYDLKFVHKVIPKEANTDVANGLFKEGKAAMIINGPWFFKQCDDAKLDIGIAKIPTLAGGTYPAPFTGARVLMVNPNIKDDNTKAAVVKLLEYLNSKEVQIEFAKVTTEIPTNLEALKDPFVTGDARLKALAEQMSVGTPMPFVPELRGVWDSMRTVMGEVMGGKTKPEDAPAKMQKLGEEQLKTLQ